MGSRRASDFVGSGRWQLQGRCERLQDRCSAHGHDSSMDMYAHADSNAKLQGCSENQEKAP